MKSDVELLASLGYKQELTRVFRPIELFGVVLSVLCIVPGFASVLVYAIPNGGPVAMVWGWLAVTPCSICVALALAELASAAPTSGGLYYWTHRFASPAWRNVLAWVVGYSNTLAYIVAMTAANWGMALMLAAAVVIGLDGAWHPTNGQTFGIFTALCVTEALASSVASRVIARLQWLYITFNIGLVLVMVIGLPASTPRESINSAKYVFTHFENATPWTNGFAFILSFLAPLFAFAGYDAPVHLSEEAANASVAVPWAMVAAVTCASVLGLAINIAIAFCMGTDLEGIMTNPIGQPMAVILLNSFGKTGMLILWSILIATFWMGATSLLTAASRQVFAFARDGALPLSGLLYRINPYTRTPVNCIWFVVALAIPLGLLSFAGPAAIGAVFTMVVAGLYLTYLIPIASRFAFKNDFKPGPFSLGAFSFPVAALAMLWMVFAIIIMLFPPGPSPDSKDMNYAVVVMGGVMMLSLAYFYFPKYGGRHRFEGPKRNIDSREPSEAFSEKAASEDEVDQ